MFFKVIIKKKSSDKVAISGDKIELNNKESEIVDYIKDNGRITNKEGRELTKLSPAGVRKIFDVLTQKELIIAVGDKKSRYYILKQ